ncbi:MAG: PIN domain-containing protein [Eubacterium sp.]|nr:PIN domain-containing protein [Eubacterium sp.]
MKNLRILIDTNIILDWLLHREPFHNNAEYIIEKCMSGNVDGYLTAHMMSDLFYILRKKLTVGKRKDLLIFLCDIMEIIVEDKKTIRKALCNEQWMDLEDGLQMQCADKEKMDYIVTRNIRDFKMSKVLAIEPEQFIEIYKTQ